MLRLSAVLLLVFVSVALAKKDKGIAVTGNGMSGQLGLGDNNARLMPEMVDNDAWFPEEPVKACGGYGHTVVLTNKGSLFVMGENVSGQLGVGDNFSRYTPTRIAEDYFDGEEIIDIACGDDHTLAVDKKNNVWGFGKNDGYELGLGDKTNRNKPEKIHFPDIMAGKVEKVFAYGFTSYALTNKGQVWSFGMDDYGQCGIGSMDQENVQTPSLFDMTNAPEGINPNSKIIDVAAGGKHALVLLESGEVLSVGFNSHGQLGTGKLEDQLLWTSSPQKVVAGWGNVKPVSLAAGYFHSLVLSKSGTLYCFGNNQNSSCGNTMAGDKIPQPVLMELDALENEKIISVAAGDYFTAMIDASHRVFACGDGSQGQLGNGQTSRKDTPTQMVMTNVPGDKFQHIDAGSSWTVLVLGVPALSNSVWIWTEVVCLVIFAVILGVVFIPACRKTGKKGFTAYIG